ncbi:MAG: hypothetical protein HY096_10590 [Nitrospinae bacterium]|nr:hypothetical protein [Nitrospinota bacterium]
MKNRIAIKYIREQGMTVSGWSRVHGFKPDTVFKFLYGYLGKRGGVKINRILDALKEEGFLR